MSITKTIINATPEQVERKWGALTEWQKDQLTYARAMKKNLAITIIDIDGLEKVLYDVAVME